MPQPKLGIERALCHAENLRACTNSVSEGGPHPTAHGPNGARSVKHTKF